MLDVFPNQNPLDEDMKKQMFENIKNNINGAALEYIKHEIIKKEH